MSTQDAQPALPPLPEPAHRGPAGAGGYFDSYTVEQMHAYARAALAAQQAAEPVEYFAAHNEMGLVYFKTAQEAAEACRANLEYERDGANSSYEWDDTATESIKWGVVVQCARAHQTSVDDDGRPHFDYRMEPENHAPATPQAEQVNGWQSWTEAEPVRLAASRARRIYVAGPMTGIEHFNFPAFNAQADALRAEGWTVLNPADHGVIKGAEWGDYLRHDIAGLATCEAIYLLPGWSKSKGARLEHSIAEALGMQMIFHRDAEATTPPPVQPQQEGQ